MSAAEPSVVLVGPMAAGKTSIGRSVAKALRVPFSDSDKSISAVHGPIPQIFAEHGESHFRALEREAIAELLAAGGVLSLGGGAVIDPETRERLTAHDVVFLTVSADAVVSRLTGSGRPLLSGEEDPVARWTRIFEERRPWYEEVADVAFDTSRVPMQRIVGQIVNWLQERKR